MKSLLLALALALAGSAGPAAAQPLTEVQVASFPLDLTGPLYYALDLGYFKKAGLDVRVQSFSNVQEGAEAMVAGSVDIGAANPSTIAQAHLRGIDFRFFAPSGLFSDKAAPTEVIAVAKSSTLRNAADLNGKTIAVAGLKTLLQAATMSWDDKRGGDAKSLKFIEVPFPEMVPALAQHRVDAIVLTEPFATAAAAETRTIGSVQEGVAPTFMTIGWFATLTWLNANATSAARFVAAIREAAAWGNAHHRESAAILARYSKMSEATLNGMARSTYGLTLDAKLVQAPIDVSARYGIIERAFPASEIMWVGPPAK